MAHSHSDIRLNALLRTCTCAHTDRQVGTVHPLRAVYVGSRPIPEVGVVSALMAHFDTSITHVIARSHSAKLHLLRTCAVTDRTSSPSSIGRPRVKL